MRTDQELLTLIQRDDEKAFAVLARRYQEELYHQIYKRLGNDDDTKDVLQNILISFWNNRHHLVTDGSILPYLSRAAKYAVINEYLFRQKKYRFEAYMALFEEPMTQSVEDTLLAEELKQEFDQQLLKMPVVIQEVFRLSREEGLSSKDIAAQLNLSEQTVRNYISSALRSLRLHLKKEDLSFLLALASACLFSDK